VLTPGSHVSEAELATVDGELRFVAIAFAD